MRSHRNRSTHQCLDGPFSSVAERNKSKEHSLKRNNRMEVTIRGCECTAQPYLDSRSDLCVHASLPGCSNGLAHRYTLHKLLLSPCFCVLGLLMDSGSPIDCSCPCKVASSRCTKNSSEPSVPKTTSDRGKSLKMAFFSAHLA